MENEMWSTVDELNMVFDVCDVTQLMFLFLCSIHIHIEIYIEWNKQKIFQNFWILFKYDEHQTITRDRFYMFFFLANWNKNEYFQLSLCNELLSTAIHIYIHRFTFQMRRHNGFALLFIALWNQIILIRL